MAVSWQRGQRWGVHTSASQTQGITPDADQLIHINNTGWIRTVAPVTVNLKIAHFKDCVCPVKLILRVLRPPWP